MNAGFDGFQKAGQENLDMMMKSFGSFGKGLQAIAAEYADYSKKSFEEGSAALEQVMSAKSPEKALEVQSTFVKDAYSGMVSEMTKLNEMYADLAREAYKSYEDVVSKVGK